MHDSARRSTRLEPEVRRQLILDAAERLLVDRSPAEVTFEAIAGAAGVSRALVHNYFRDRTALLLALAEQSLERLDQALDEALDTADDLTEQIEAIGRIYRHHARTEAAAALLCRAGLLDHPDVLAARTRRVTAIATRWGGTTDALVAAWAVTALLEVAEFTPLPPGTGPDALLSFVSDLIAPALRGRGVGPPSATATADEP